MIPGRRGNSSSSNSSSSSSSSSAVEEAEESLGDPVPAVAGAGEAAVAGAGAAGGAGGGAGGEGDNGGRAGRGDHRGRYAAYSAWRVAQLPSHHNWPPPQPPDTPGYSQPQRQQRLHEGVEYTRSSSATQPPLRPSSRVVEADKADLLHVGLADLVRETGQQVQGQQGQGHGGEDEQLYNTYLYDDDHDADGSRAGRLLSSLRPWLRELLQHNFLARGKTSWFCRLCEAYAHTLDPASRRCM